jgi:hypothetical protein
MLFDEKILRQKEWSSVLIKKQNKRKSQTSRPSHDTPYRHEHLAFYGIKFFFFFNLNKIKYVN